MSNWYMSSNLKINILTTDLSVSVNGIPILLITEPHNLGITSINGFSADSIIQDESILPYFY